MLTPWQLPTRAVIGGKSYEIHTDYRDILELFSYFDDPQLPHQMKWLIALALFYEGQIPEKDRQEAMEFLVRFINCGEEEGTPGPKLLDWEQDGALIIADTNRAAGRELRALPYMHWWSFMSCFHAIGQGRLSTVVAIRKKLSRGQKLEEWEKHFYRENKSAVDMKKRYTQQELRERQRLQSLLGD